jgi:hypothetical protein
MRMSTVNSADLAPTNLETNRDVHVLAPPAGLGRFALFVTSLLNGGQVTGSMLGPLKKSDGVVTVNGQVIDRGPLAFTLPENVPPEDVL